MKIRIVALCLVLCLVLSGCTGWMDGSYSSVKLHRSSQNQPGGEAIAVSSYAQLRDALAELVESGAESVLINVAQMDQDAVRAEMDRAVQYILETNPIGAYAVDEIEYEQGTSGGQPALAVTVRYNQNLGALRSIQTANGMEAAETLVAEALSQCESKLVMRVSRFRPMDFDQFVRNYMQENPQIVIEQPQLTVSTYPEAGTERVVEIAFTYQTDRDDLRTMQSRVRPLLISAELYVSGNNSSYEKYALLYAFLMERHEYEIETSITPAYSLLIHGVGDSRAFAVMFAAMSSRAELECRVVSGTRNGEPHFWNIICVDGVYHHLDLLDCSAVGAFEIRGDEQMSGYVWDYSAYPECDVYIDPTELTEPPAESQPEQTTETDPTIDPEPGTDPTITTEPETVPPEEPTEPNQATEPEETTTPAEGTEEPSTEPEETTEPTVPQETE